MKAKVEYAAHSFRVRDYSTFFCYNGSNSGGAKVTRDRGMQVPGEVPAVPRPAVLDYGRELRRTLHPAAGPVHSPRQQARR
jgi:hypothetical protein